MAKGVTPDDEKRAATYVDLRTSGVGPKEAQLQAGYSASTPRVQIERPGGPVDNLMVKALEEKGITEEFLANEYAKGLELSLSPAAEGADCQAHAKYLLQLGYLKGYGRTGPSVAVQINNNPQAAQEHDLGRIEDTLREVGSVLAMVREELSKRDSDGVHEQGDQLAGGDQLHADSAAHPGVGEAGGDA